MRSFAVYVVGFIGWAVALSKSHDRDRCDLRISTEKLLSLSRYFHGEKFQIKNNDDPNGFLTGPGGILTPLLWSLPCKLVAGQTCARADSVVGA